MKKIFTLLSVVVLGTFANAQIVINEVYGGGGSTTSLIKQDFVELINNSASAVTLTGAYIQYGGATSTTTIGATYIQALPAITLNPGQTFLVVEGGNSAGTDISGLADATGTLNFGATGGKIFLTSNNTPVAGPSDTNIIDHVSWGTSAVWSETSPAGATSVSTSISRTNGADTNNNSVDFTVGAPTPKNTSGSTLSAIDFNKFKNNFVKNTIVTNEINFGEKANVKIYNVSGSLVKSASVEKNTSLNVSSLPKGIYVVTGEVNGQSVSQKILKK